MSFPAIYVKRAGFRFSYSREERLLEELQRLERLDRDTELDLDDELAGEDTEIELLASRVRAARFAGAMSTGAARD